MEWVVTVGSARFGVVGFVRGGYDELAAPRQHPPDFQKKFAPLLQVLDHLESHHQVEAAVGVRQRGAGGLLEAEVRQPVVFLREIHGFGGDVDSQHGGRHFRQFR